MLNAAVPGEYRIRRYRRDDHAGLIRFLTASFSELGKEFRLDAKDSDIGDIDDVYLSHRGSFHVVDAGGEICGLVGVRKYSDEIAELKRLYLAPGYRGKGLGKALCALAIQDAKDAGFKRLRLDTTRASKAAIQIFKEFGFQEIDRYNANPVAEIFMEKVL